MDGTGWLNDEHHVLEDTGGCVPGGTASHYCCSAVFAIPNAVGPSQLQFYPTTFGTPSVLLDNLRPGDLIPQVSRTQLAPVKHLEEICARKFCPQVPRLHNSDLYNTWRNLRVADFWSPGPRVQLGSVQHLEEPSRRRLSCPGIDSDVYSTWKTKGNANVPRLDVRAFYRLRSVSCPSTEKCLVPINREVLGSDQKRSAWCRSTTILYALRWLLLEVSNEKAVAPANQVKMMALVSSGSRS